MRRREEQTCRNTVNDRGGDKVFKNQEEGDPNYLYRHIFRTLRLLVNNRTGSPNEVLQCLYAHSVLLTPGVVKTRVNYMANCRLSCLAVKEEKRKTEFGISAFVFLRSYSPSLHKVYRRRHKSNISTNPGPIHLALCTGKTMSPHTSGWNETVEKSWWRTTGR